MRKILIIFIIILQLFGITFLLSAEQDLKYADFDQGFFEPSFTWGDTGNGAKVNISIFEGGYNSDYCLKIDYTFKGWGCGFQICNDAGAEITADCIGAKLLVLWVKLPVDTVFSIGFEDAEGEQWHSEGIKQNKSEWQKHEILLSSLHISQHAGNQNGNQKMDLNEVKGIQINISDSPQSKGEMFIDEITFIGVTTETKKITKVSRDEPFFNKTIKVKDGWIYVNDEKFFVRGIGYSPCRPMTNPGEPVDIRLIEKDFQLIKEAGFNTLRTWGPMGKEWLDLAQKYDLKVIQGIWIDPNRDEYSDKAYINSSINEVKRVVKYSRKYDNILMYLVINEPHIGAILNTGVSETLKFFKKLRKTAKSLDPNRPVTFTPCVADEFLEDYSFWDVIAYNVYMYGPFTRSDGALGYRGYIESLKKRFAPDKPLIITEFGLPVSPAGPGKFGYGGNTLEEQKEGVLYMYNELIQAGATGCCVFEWIDEWWKSGEPHKHNKLPEEWFGIMAIKGAGNPESLGVPRPILHALKQNHQAIFIEPKNMLSYTVDVPIEVFAMESVKKISYKVDDGDWQGLNKKGDWWNGKIKASTLKDGNHNFEIKALDEKDVLIKSAAIQFAVYNKNKKLAVDPVKIILKTDKDTYKTGETIQGKILVVDREKKPIAGKTVLYDFFWPKAWHELSFKAKTDKNGIVNFSYPLNYETKKDCISIAAGISYKIGDKYKRFGDIKNIEVVKGTYVTKRRTVNIIKAASKINIDGKIDKEWERADKIYIKDIVDDIPMVRDGRWDGLNDLSAEIRLLYDDKNIYLLANITDDLPARNSETKDKIWNGDCLEFYIGTEPSKIPLEGYSSSDYQIAIGANGKMWIYGQTSGGTRNMPPMRSKVKVKKIKGGYIMEVKLNLSNFKSWKGKDEIRIDFALNDEDITEGREGQIIWNGKTDNYKNSINWGSGILK
ncbi:MAG: hypothetical protein KAT05_08345 [Spirochaetes bacterium]|nr:hypothetical protein [Spirochaetota bacterium]